MDKMKHKPLVVPCVWPLIEAAFWHSQTFINNLYIYNTKLDDLSEKKLVIDGFPDEGSLLDEMRKLERFVGLVDPFLEVGSSLRNWRCFLTWLKGWSSCWSIYFIFKTPMFFMFPWFSFLFKNCILQNKLFSINTPASCPGTFGYRSEWMLISLDISQMLQTLLNIS